MTIMLDDSEVLLGDKVYDNVLEEYGYVISLQDRVGFNVQYNNNKQLMYGGNGTLGGDKRVFWDKPILIYKKHKNDVKYDVFLKCLPDFNSIVNNIVGVKRVKIQSVATNTQINNKG